MEGVPNFEPTETDEEAVADKPFRPIPKTFHPLLVRGFDKHDSERYKLDVPQGKEAGYVARYPIYTTTGIHCGNKIRYANKKFSFEGPLKNVGLFGRHAFEPGSSRAITVAEGPDDAVAIYHMFGQRYASVAIHSASTAERDVRNDFEYLNSFDKIVFCFDNDEAGHRAIEKVKDLPFPIGKVHILNLRLYKDANDYLLNGKEREFQAEWWDAPVHRPDGLKLGSEMWPEIINRNESFTTRYPWEGLNTLTYGLRLSEMVVITADTKVGKTSIIKHIEHKLLTDEEIKEKGYGVGFLHFEEPNGDTALGLLSIHNGVPYHLPDADRPEKDLKRAFEEVLDNNRSVIWDHFGSNSVDAVVDKVRHMAAIGCKYIVIDHLSIIVSDQSGDERKQLDEIATKLKTLTMELDVAVIAVIHTNRQGQIRGTAGVEQLANIVIRLERDKLDENEWRRNITKVSVTENRFCGYTGPASYLYYDRKTSRLTELAPDAVIAYNEGGTIADDSIPF